MRCWIVVAALLLTACGVEPAAQSPREIVRPARIYEVGAGVDVTRRSFVARVEAPQTVDLSFQVSGPLVKLPVREGEVVSRGALIAALDPGDFQRAVREAQVQLDLARADLTRKRELLKDSMMSVAVVDEAEANYELRRVRLDQAREDLSDTRITAPFDAYVSQRFVDNYVNVNAGDDIVRVLDLTRLNLVTNLPEQIAATVDEEQVASVTAEFAFAPGRRFPLEYRENRGEAGAVAQTYEVTYTMAQPQGLRILPGMTATVELALRARDSASANTIEIPAAALVAAPDRRYYVWSFDRDSGAVARRDVEIGVLAGDTVSVTAGLAPGDLIVAAGAHQLADGMRVRPLGDVARGQARLTRGDGREN